MIIRGVSKDKTLALQHAFCVALAFTVACIICFSFKLLPFHGYWLPMTVLLMFAAPIHGSIKKRSSDRIIGTVAGVMLSFFVVNIFFYLDYRWTYLLPVFNLFVSYIYFMSGNYAVAAIFITTLVPTSYVVEYGDSYKFDNTLAFRLFLTALGITIAYICEMTIYKKASLSTRNAKYHSRNYFKTISEVISLTSDCFISRKTNMKNIIAKIKLMIRTVSSIENIFVNIRYESDNKTDNNSILIQILYTINKIDCSLRRIMSLILNNKFDNTVIPKKEFEFLVNEISNKYKKFAAYSHGRNIEKIYYPLDLTKCKDITPTHLFLSEIYELNNLFDKLTKNISKLNRVQISN
ncbi:MAG TPA: FUSC family protein [Victivallales bacterium]|nr:FUSC family protein [Victivallales bacterium]